MIRAALLAVILLLAAAPGAAARVVSVDPHGAKHQLKGKRIEAAPLPETLVIEPGRYEIGKRSYHLRAGGYRTPEGYRIAYQGARSVLSGIAWQSEQRNPVTDDALPMDQLAELAKRRKLNISCGVTSSLAIHLLGPLGVQARRVGLVPAGEFDDAHTLLEVKIRGRWQLWDLDYDMRPLWRGRTVLAQVYPRRERRLSFDWIAGDGSRFSKLPAVYRNVMGTALIEDGGYFYFTDPVAGHSPGEVSASRNGWYQYLPRPEFFARFYTA